MRLMWAGKARSEGAVKGSYLKNKATVFGIIQRQGDFRGWIVPDEKKNTLLPIVQRNVAPGSVVSTDKHKTYRKLSKLGYEHGVVDHHIDEWVRGIHHTNTIEGFWSHLKKGICSTHVSVSRQHLEKYVREFGFRFDHRHEPAQMLIDYSHKSEVLLSNTKDAIIKQAIEIFSMIRIVLRL